MVFFKLFATHTFTDANVLYYKIKLARVNCANPWIAPTGRAERCCDESKLRLTESNNRSLGNNNRTSTGRQAQHKHNKHLKHCSNVIWLQCDLATESWINNVGTWHGESWWRKVAKFNSNKAIINQRWVNFASLMVCKWSGFPKNVITFSKSECNL